MAANKLSWTELRRTLAHRAGVSEKEASVFLNALQSQLIEALKTDKQVKINGLGTFKLQAVAPRKSVNVTTGEEITIAGYNKMVFTPEAGVKEMVEKGAKSERVKELKNEGETVDPLKKLGAQAEEIVDILGELGQSPKEKKKEVRGKRKEVRTPKKPIEPKEPEKPEIPQEPIKPIEQEKPIEPELPKEPKKREYHFMRDTLICVVVLIMLLFVGYFFLRSQLSSWIDEMVQEKPKTEVVTSEEDPISEVSETSEVSEVSAESEVSEISEYAYDELLLTEEITAGSRLAWIAKKHYGNKVYWVYLYDANKDRIENPSKIAVGTPIRVPKLNAAMRDTTSVRFQQIREEAIQRIEN